MGFVRIESGFNDLRPGVAQATGSISTRRFLDWLVAVNTGWLREGESDLRDLAKLLRNTAHTDLHWNGD